MSKASKARSLPAGLLPAGLDIEDAATYCGGVSENMLREMVRLGLISPPCEFGNRKIFLRERLDRDLAALPTAKWERQSDGPQTGQTASQGLKNWD
jgi:hypothetical protein